MSDVQASFIGPGCANPPRIVNPVGCQEPTVYVPGECALLLRTCFQAAFSKEFMGLNLSCERGQVREAYKFHLGAL